MALGDEVDQIFRREVKSLPAYVKAQAASGSGIAPPVDRGLYGQYPLGLRVLLEGVAVSERRGPLDREPFAAARVDQYLVDIMSAR